MNSCTHFCFKRIHILNDSVAADVSVVADLRGECVIAVVVAVAVAIAVAIVVAVAVAIAIAIGLILHQFIHDIN
jgi:hypothetical protein